jgi:hypothetical protein
MPFCALFFFPINFRVLSRTYRKALSLPLNEVQKKQLYGLIYVWLNGCMAAWLHGCMVAKLHSCIDHSSIFAIVLYKTRCFLFSASHLFIPFFFTVFGILFSLLTGSRLPAHIFFPKPDGGVTTTHDIVADVILKFCLI